MEHQRVGLQRRFEFIPAEFNGLIVIVRTDSIQLQAVVHESSGCLELMQRMLDSSANLCLHELAIRIVHLSSEGICADCMSSCLGSAAMLASAASNTAPEDRSENEKAAIAALRTISAAQTQYYLPSSVVSPARSGSWGTRWKRQEHSESRRIARFRSGVGRQEWLSLRAGGSRCVCVCHQRGSNGLRHDRKPNVLFRSDRCRSRTPRIGACDRPGSGSSLVGALKLRIANRCSVVFREARAGGVSQFRLAGRHGAGDCRIPG